MMETKKTHNFTKNQEFNLTDDEICMIDINIEYHKMFLGNPRGFSEGSGFF